MVSDVDDLEEPVAPVARLRCYHPTLAVTGLILAGSLASTLVFVEDKFVVSETRQLHVLLMPEPDNLQVSIFAAKTSAGQNRAALVFSEVSTTGDRRHRRQRLHGCDGCGVAKKHEAGAKEREEQASKLIYLDRL